MFYNQFGYKQWVNWPFKTFIALMYDLNIVTRKMEVNEDQKDSYDTNADGNCAPETVFLSSNN